MTLDGPGPTIAQLGRALRSGQITSVQATERCLHAIAERNGSLNAFIDVYADSALRQAQDADAEIAAGHDRGPLHGVPIALKDLFDVAGARTTAASRVRSRHIAETDATVVARLRHAGAVFVGKNNLHEFALGTTNEDSAFGPARHPLDLQRSPGGSSGGSAAAVLAGMAFAAIGTDTGGSVRIPASVCGLVGLKPTVGEVPLDGVVPLSPTLDHVGPLCRSVEDAQLLFDVLADNSLRPPQAPAAAGLRLAVLREYFAELLDPAVESAFAQACARLAYAGATLGEARIAHAREIATVYVHIALAEASAYHAPMLDRQPGDYTPNVRMRLEMGRYILEEDYARALAGRDALRREVDAALEQHDALLLPTVAVPAIRIGRETVRVGDSEEPVRNVMLRLTQLFNITGHPAITLPCGATTDGLPIGAQLVGRFGRTAELLRLAGTLEPHLGPGKSR